MVGDALLTFSNVLRRDLFIWYEMMSSFRRCNGAVKTSNVGNSRIVRNRSNSVSSADRTVTPTSSSTVHFRNRGSRLSSVIPVTSTDNASATSAANASRRRKSLDKVRFCCSQVVLSKLACVLM